ncbi:azurin [Mariniflexile gromovii]|uniref:Azurin n=1 Tax=Mariniflexile gromovii TaxID=362523 RepID=A0ABS4BR35_9FLAO|nr:azurin [Mariniflexile gromovii]MBP0903031.1 azurin [Mariniflexile gromovii]
MKIVKFVSCLVFSCFVLIGCGGKEEKKKEGFTYEKTEEVKSVKEESNVETVVLVGTDLMKFDKAEIRVPAGKKIKLTLRHTGKMDINVMGHNFVLLKQGVDMAAFAGKAATSKDNNYIPKDAEQDIIAHTDLIGGGQTTSIEFDAPPAGTYDFLCSFPAHYMMMKGKFIVE